jgi:LacI family transcriptional regulator, galactose operon repressor
MSRRRLTMSDIAREAGVSKGTVSRVLNGREGVGSETRERILSLMAEHEYHASFSAQSLAVQRSFNIGVVFPGPASGVLANPTYTELLGAIGDRSEESGYGLSLLTTSTESGDERVLRDVARGRLDGVLLPGVRDGDSTLDRLIDGGAPTVLIGHRDDRVPWTDSDGDRAFHDMTTALVRAGHRRLAFLDGPTEYMACRLRQEGFERALGEAGLEPVAITSGPFSSDYGFREAGRLLDGRDRPTAIMAGSDLIAAGCMAAIRERGLRVPQDVAVTGFDDDRLAPVMSPPLTSVRMPIRDLGVLAVELLLALIENEPIEHRTHLLRSTVVMRASSGEAALT